MRRRRWIALLLALAMVAVLTACGEEAAPTPSPELTAAPSAQPAPEAAEFALACYPDAGFHPITGTNRTNLDLGGLLYEGLFALDQSFQVQQQLCQSYTVSEDGLTWTFVLQSGVTFSDGSALTGAEVAASLNLARTSQLYANRLADVQSVTGEGSQVQVVLRRANGALPSLLDIPIVKGTGGNPLGTGPYVLTGEGETLALTARTDWWQGKDLPKQSIPLRSIQEADDLIHAFDTRDIALVATDLTGTNALGFSGSFDTVDYPTSNMLYVGFNTQKGPCRDSGVRRALQWGFDRSAVATVLLSRHAWSAALPISPASAYYPEDLVETLEYSPQMLTQTLSEAGWSQSGDGWRKSGETLSLTLVVPTGNADRLAVAQHLADGLGQEGIAVEVKALAWADYLQALQKGEFDLYLGEVRLTADFDLTALITPNGTLNYGKYQDTEASSLLEAFRIASGQGRDLAGRRLYARLMEEPPFAVLCFKNGSVLTQWSQISGMTPTQQNIFYGFADWNLV